MFTIFQIVNILMILRYRNFVLGEGHKPLIKILVCTDIICNIVSIQSQTFDILKTKNNFKILTNLKTNLERFYKIKTTFANFD